MKFHYRSTFTCERSTQPSQLAPRVMQLILLITVSLRESITQDDLIIRNRLRLTKLKQLLNMRLTQNKIISKI